LLYNLISHLFRLFLMLASENEPSTPGTTCKNIKIHRATQIKLIYFHIVRAQTTSSHNHRDYAPSMRIQCERGDGVRVRWREGTTKFQI
jgi:hypothetical protein